LFDLFQTPEGVLFMSVGRFLRWGSLMKNTSEARQEKLPKKKSLGQGSTDHKSGVNKLYGPRD